MKKLFYLTIILIVGFMFMADLAEGKGGRVHVKGYFKKNGTYVQPHYRTAPDGNLYNNWSASGNVNPYTSKTGSGSSNNYLKDYYYSKPKGGSNYTFSSKSIFPLENRTNLVKGYFRKNGTYVSSYNRSSSNRKSHNNWNATVSYSNTDYQSGIPRVAIPSSSIIRVKSYLKPSSGQFIFPYYRTSPNKSKFDNFGTLGNFNLFTGKKGTVKPF